jgi:hypothetical protein
MEQVTNFVYRVAQSESVTIHVTPIEENPAFVQASTEGRAIPNSSTDANPAFQFPIDVASGGVQFAIVLCSFPFDTPDDAKCDMSLEGSAGGNFTGPTIEKGDQVHAANFTFIVQ